MGSESTQGSHRFEMTSAEKRTYKFARFIAKLVTSSYIRLTVEGKENIPADGPFILAPGGHRSYIDTPIATQVMDRIPRFMGGHTFFEKPLLGKFLYSVGGFPVEREATDRAAMDLAEQLLGSGQPLVMFPEGARFWGPELAEIKLGVAFLACRAQVPVVPVGLGGLEALMAKNSKFVRPGKASAIIGKPLNPPEKTGSRVKRSKVIEFSELMTTELQKNFYLAESRVS